MKILNYEELIYSTPSQELQKLRNHLLSILESSLDSVNSQKMVVKSVILRNGKIVVNDQYLDLLDFENIFVIGGGKACGGMCKAIEDLMGDFITRGIVNVLSGTEEKYKLNKIELVGASHPIPNEKGINGVKKMAELLSGITRRDLVIVLISGGGSALMPFPADDISINDIQIITEKLLLNGATINELNIVRKHLSGWKGGQLAKICYPAMVVSLILSDVVDDKLDVIASGPTVPDSSTFSDTKDVLVKYDMWNSVSPYIKERISKGITGEIKDTPKKSDIIFERVRNHVIGNNKIVCEAALKTAKKLGYTSRIISTSLEGEAREIGKKIANYARDVYNSYDPNNLPYALIFGGETTVRVTGEGVGGRNLEVALGALQGISGLKCVIATLATDGLDGVSEVAGGIVDGLSYKRSIESGLNVEESLNNNDSYTFLKSLSDVICTGPTGTNVNDLTVILCG